MQLKRFNDYYYKIIKKFLKYKKIFKIKNNEFFKHLTLIILRHK